jgi:hypothetical protein
LTILILLGCDGTIGVDFFQWRSRQKQVAQHRLEGRFDARRLDTSFLLQFFHKCLVQRYDIAIVFIGLVLFHILSSRVNLRVLISAMTSVNLLEYHDWDAARRHLLMMNVLRMALGSEFPQAIIFLTLCFSLPPR